ncbi:hypothetical protein [Microbacterium sp.]|uniref:hypothetical protein n=1 Tax=Microbacterium sp. TaxID=51671 RepID=UPI003F9DD63A
MADGQAAFGFALTVEQWHDEADELIFRTTTGAATIAELKRLQQLLEYRMHALRTGHHVAEQAPSVTNLPPRLNELIGEVVICCAVAEEHASELLQLRSGDLDKAVDGYGSTSSRLLRKLKGKIPDELHERFRDALDFRHYIVHGVYVDAKFFLGKQNTFSQDGYVAMKQSFGNDAPGFTVRYINEAELIGLRDRLTSISAELSTLISQAMDGFGRVGP